MYKINEYNALKQFKGTRSPWGVFYTSVMGQSSSTPQEITVMPDINRMSQHISVSWDKSQIGRNGGLNIEEAECNARLIAAAPDLLAACDELLQYWLGTHGPNEMTEFAEAAIAKALGNGK